MTAPVSLIVSAFAPVRDIRRTLTPELVRDADTVLVLIDLADGALRLGGSCLAQSFGQFGGEPPDLDDPARLKAFFAAQRELRDAELVLAYHDRSDGGLFATLAEMAFAGNVGLDVELGTDVTDAIAFTLASETPDAGDRSFASFSEAAAESGLSRIYGGIHWSFDNVQGLETGAALGHFVTENFLRPQVG